MNFDELKLAPAILKAVHEHGYDTPTPIQAQAIPVVLDGHDLLGGAQTGTGKTAAFTLPMLHKLSMSRSATNKFGGTGIRALVLTPTRELAAQVEESVRTYGKYLQLESTVIFGGVGMNPQISKLKKGVDILVATPGRLLDLQQQGMLDLAQVQMLILDEADRMLDMGFLPDLERIIRLLPTQRQGLLFSATFSNEIRKLGRSYLNHPVEIEVAARNATATTITQIAYKMSGDAKRAAVVHLVKSRGLKQVIVFSNTKIGTARLARELERDGVKAESIHGDKTQADRMKALEAFKAGELEVLVATDVAARGLDVAGVPCVINYDLPYNAEDYVHRIGRTGRAGASGEAIALFTPDEERFLLDIEKLIKREVPRGTLDLPADAVARSHRRSDERSGSSSREGRESSRDSRGDRGDRGRSSDRRSGYTSGGSRQPVDDFFLKPYEPSASSSTAEEPAPSNNTNGNSSSAPKRQVAVLLGGSRKN